MLTCGAVGAALAVVAVTGLSMDDGGGFGSSDAPETVTLAPIVIDLGGAKGKVQVSLRLTVSGSEERLFICARERSLLATAERVVKNEVVGQTSSESVPRHLDHSLRSYIERILGERRIEGLQVTVTSLDAAPPRPNCGGRAS